MSYVPYDKSIACPTDRVAWALCQIIDDDAPLRWTRYRGVVECIAKNPEVMADLEMIAGQDKAAQGGVTEASADNELAAKRYIRDWVPDCVRDYVAKLEAALSAHNGQIADHIISGLGKIGNTVSRRMADDIRMVVRSMKALSVAQPAEQGEVVAWLFKLADGSVQYATARHEVLIPRPIIEVTEVGVGVDMTTDGAHVCVRLGDTVVHSQFYPAPAAQPAECVPGEIKADLPPGYRMASRDGEYWPLFGDAYATERAFPTRELAALAAWKQAHDRLDRNMASIRKLAATTLTAPPAQPAERVPEGWREDVALAAQMLTWGADEGLTESQERDVRAHQAKLFALLATPAAPAEEGDGAEGDDCERCDGNGGWGRLYSGPSHLPSTACPDCNGTGKKPTGAAHDHP